MRVLVAHVSPNGTTKAVTKIMVKALSELSLETVALDIGRAGWRPDEPGFEAKVREGLRGIDALGIGGPVYHLRYLEPAMRFLRIAMRNADPGLRVFAFATYGGIASGAALRNAARTTRRMGGAFCGALKITAPHFYKSTPFPDEKAARAVSGFASALAESDFREVSVADSESILGLSGMKRAAYALAPLLGRLRRLRIRVDAEACTGCGRCARECPAGAFRGGRPASRDARVCLYCYHCAVACPAGAIRCHTERIETFVHQNERILGAETPGNAFFVREKGQSAGWRAEP